MVPFLLLAVLGLSLLLLEWRSVRRRGRHGREEERAHHKASERRKERRYAVSATSVTCSLLGDARPALTCRILDVSRSGMRIAISQPLPHNAQINVVWGDQCFVGASCYSFAKGDEHILGLRTIASTCTELGFFSDVKYQWNELWWRAAQRT